MEIVANNEKQITKYGEKIDLALVDFREATESLRDNLKKTAESEMRRCRAIAQIAEGCEEYGRPSFSWIVENECGIDHSNASQMKKIGQDEKLGKFTQLLPAGISAMNEIRQMTEEQVEEAVEKEILHPGATAATLKAFRTGGKAKTETKKKSQPVTVDGFSVELLDLTQEQVIERLTALGDILPPDVVEAASDHDNPNFFACRSLAMSQDAMLRSLEPLTKKEQSRLLAAFSAVFQHNQKVFDFLLKTERPKRIAALEERLKRKIEDADERLRKIRAGNVSIDEHGVQVMLRADFKRFLGALHPDKHPGQEEKYQVLFNDFKAYEDAYRG